MYVYVLTASDSTVHGVLQLTTAKECARQISELSKDEFTLLQTTINPTHTTTSDHAHISTEESVAVQLSVILEELSREDDSGAVSDWESSAATTELFSDCSSTHLIDEHAQSDHQDTPIPALMEQTSCVSVESISEPAANHHHPTSTPLTPPETERTTPPETETTTEHSTESIPVCSTITKTCWRTKQLSQSDQRRHTSPVDVYLKTKSTGHAGGQSRSTHGKRRGRRRGGGWRGHYRHTGGMWRDRPITYNHDEVAAYLLKSESVAFANSTASGLPLVVPRCPTVPSP